jgi:hypothetical protein
MILRRPRLQPGQILFELPVIRDASKPSVILHKNGRYILFRPQSIQAAVIFEDLLEKVQHVPQMRDGKYWNINRDGEQVVVKDWKKIELWKHLEGDVTKHPMCQVLQARGVEIGLAPTLEGYIRKEWKRFQLESTPYPTPAATGTASLFERCCVGTSLRCTKNFIDPTYPEFETKLFEAGKHYMVVGVGGDGVDAVKISKTDLRDGSTVKDDENVYEWSEFGDPMEDYFDDSEDADLGKTTAEMYPAEVAAMRKRIDELGYELFEHVKVDAAMEAMKRGTINGKLMRMGKTSEALTLLDLWGSKKVAVFGSMNVCMTWEKECKRLGITDYVIVDQLSDLEKPGRIYLMRYGWIRQQEDKSASERKNYVHYLRAGERSYQYRIPGTNRSLTARYSVLNHHPCPHCNKAMVRPLLQRDPTGKVYRVDWTPLDGYMCRNKDCVWTSDNRKKKGAAWATKGNRLVHHKGGYVDWGLAAHSRCSHENIRGRQCMDCGETDGVWIPQITKRFKKKFTAVVPDEIHNMKDPHTLTYKAVSRMRARRKYGMTGTFISNGAMDTYWIFHWLLRGASLMFPYSMNKGAKEFEGRFCSHATLEKPAGIDEETGEVIKKLVSKRQPFLKNPTDWWRFIASKFMRRNYSDPMYEQSLIDAGMFKPDISVDKVVCPMTTDQIKLMLSAMKDFKDVYEAHKREAEEKNHDINKTFVISKMATMCTIATSPEAMNDKLGFKVYDGPAGGGKMYPVIQLIKSKVQAGGKVLVLSDFLAMQRALEEELTREGLKVIRFNTGWNLDKRREAQEQFAEDPETTVMIAGTRAVSESLDFSPADTCVCCDLLWAPAFQQQAWSRILQATKRRRDCKIYLALSGNSIDEHKYDTFYAKLVAAEQSQDRRVMTRRAMTVDIKWFADRVIEEEANLTLQLADLGQYDVVRPFVLPELDMSLMEERVV